MRAASLAAHVVEAHGAPHRAPPEQLCDRGKERASRCPGAARTAPAPLRVRTHCALTLGGTRGGQRAQATSPPGAPNPDRERAAARQANPQGRRSAGPGHRGPAGAERTRSARPGASPSDAVTGRSAGGVALAGPLSPPSRPRRRRDAQPAALRSEPRRPRHALTAASPSRCSGRRRPLASRARAGGGAGGLSLRIGSLGPRPHSASPAHLTPPPAPQAPPIGPPPPGPTAPTPPT